MELPLTKHAIYEMHRRNISAAEVAAVFENPMQKIKVTEKREIWQNKTVVGEKVYLLRIVVELKPKLAIVTAYKTSKIGKYWKRGH